MTVEKTQLKFAKSEETGKLIGFVSRHPKRQKLMGVREDSPYGKKICVLSKELNGKIEPDKLYAVELKPMHNGAGYVVVAARPILFPAQVCMEVLPKIFYRITISFGHKVIFFDPKDGKSESSRTLSGVIKLIRERDDIENPELVIKDLTSQARQLVTRMIADGLIVSDHTLR